MQVSQNDDGSELRRGAADLCWRQFGRVSLCPATCLWWGQDFRLTHLTRLTSLASSPQGFISQLSLAPRSRPYQKFGASKFRASLFSFPFPHHKTTHKTILLRIHSGFRPTMTFWRGKRRTDQLSYCVCRRSYPPH